MGGSVLPRVKDRYHFVGVGGVGMSALATVLLARGHPVTGSDLRDGPAARRLRSLGARITLGHDPASLDHPDWVVVSSAVPAGNPEVLAARRLGIPVIHRAELLARVMQRRRGIAVAGSHGKSTTTSMIGLTLLAGACDPTIVVGGEVPAIGGNARVGRGRYVVAEADESDGSFLHLHPWIAVVTNIDDDHLDHYRDREAILEACVSFLGGLRPGGLAVLCWDDRWVRRLARRCSRPLITYALDGEVDLRAADVRCDGLGSSYDAVYRGNVLGRVRLGVPGLHNVQNSLAAVAVALHLGVGVEAVDRGLRDFHGVGRRFEVLNPGAGVMVVDDYAHHPTEVRTTLHAARALTRGRLLVAFQPHRYTRTQLLAPAFGPAFADADGVFLTEVYGAGESPIPGVSAELIAAAIRDAGRPPVELWPTQEELVRRLASIVREGDVVLSMGAGDIRWTGQRLASLFPAAPRPSASRRGGGGRGSR